MKRLMSFLVITVILFAVSVYAKCDEVWPERNALIRKAQELSGRLSAFVRNDAAAGLYITEISDIDKVMKTIASYDYGQPTDAMVFLFDDALIQYVVSQYITHGIELPDAAWFPDVLKTELLSVLPNLLNGQIGTTWISACSRMQMMDVFSMDGVRGGAGCVIFSFAEDQPSVAVSFCINDDSAVLAYATFLKLPNNIKADGKALIDFVLSRLEKMPDIIIQALNNICIDDVSGKELAKILEQ